MIEVGEALPSRFLLSGQGNVAVEAAGQLLRIKRDSVEGWALLRAVRRERARPLDAAASASSGRVWDRIVDALLFVFVGFHVVLIHPVPGVLIGVVAVVAIVSVLLARSCAECGWHRQRVASAVWWKLDGGVIS